MVEQPISNPRITRSTTLRAWSSFGRDAAQRVDKARGSKGDADEGQPDRAAARKAQVTLAASSTAGRVSTCNCAAFSSSNAAVSAGVSDITSAREPHLL